MDRPLRNRSRWRLACVFLLAIGLPGVLLSYGSLKSIEADRDALRTLRAERLRDAAREAVVRIEDELAERTRAALAALDPEALVDELAPWDDHPVPGAYAWVQRRLHEVARREPLVKGLFVLDPGGDPLFPRPDLEEAGEAPEIRAGLLSDVRAAARASPPPSGEPAMVTTVRADRPHLVAYRLVRPPIEGAGPPGYAVGVELDLDRVLTNLARPWLTRLGEDRRAALSIHGTRGGLLVRGEGAPAAESGEAEVVAAAVRPEVLLPFWTLRASLPADDGEEARARARLLLQAGMVAVLLGAMLLGAAWTFRALHRSLELAEAKAEFVANVSHELRTPLTSIRMLAELLQRGAGPPPERRARYIDTIAREAGRLEELIDGILEFARHDAGRRGYRLETAHLGAAAREALAAVGTRLQEDGFEVEVAIDDDAPAVHADAAALELAIRNLLSNAIKYSPPDRRWVRLAVERADGGVRVSVADRGLGIAPAEQPRLFEKFYRGSQALELGRPGSGLGLALVQRIASDHGGRVEVRSSPGEGATFSIWLPAAARGDAA